jgi:signal transduction histidine kinase
MREMDLLFREKQAEAEARRKAEALLEKEKESQEETEEPNFKTDDQYSPPSPEEPQSDPDYKEERDTYKKAFEAVKSDLEDAEEEVRILSALATTGLIVTSFAHEFSSFQWKLAHHTNYLERELLSLLDKDKIDIERPTKKNPFVMLKKLKDTHLGINQWLNIALAAVRKDKRLSDDIDIKKYMSDFEISWYDVLKTRKVKLNISTDIIDELKFTAYIIDVDSIFNNLLVNSFDAFDVDGFVGERIVSIDINVFESLEEQKNYLQVKYRDNGPGLNKKIKNPNLILRRGYTTKVDKSGNEIGTGLGMWLVNDAVSYYGGTIKIETPQKGFEIKIHLPLNSINHE